METKFKVGDKVRRKIQELDSGTWIYDCPKELKKSVFTISECHADTIGFNEIECSTFDTFRFELIETEGGNKMEFKVGDRVRNICGCGSVVKDRIYIVEEHNEYSFLCIGGIKDSRGGMHEYCNCHDDWELVEESSETLQTTQMEKTVFNVLVVNKKTSKVEKDETVVASNEKEAILRAYGVDVDNVAFNVTERSKFTEDKPQTVVVEDTKGK